MNIELFNFLEDFKSDSLKFYSHSSMFQPTGKFMIEGEKFEEFMDLYCSLFNKEQSRFCSGLAEKKRDDCLPILIDADITFEYDGKTDLSRKVYSENDIKSVISSYNKVLKSIIKNLKDKDLCAFVLEKPNPIKVGSKVKGAGFHIHYPRLWIKIQDHAVHLIPRVTERLKQDNVFANISQVTEKEKIIDKGYLSKNWLMYGSRKDATQFPYLLSNIYNSRLEKVSLSEALDGYNIYDIDGNIIEMDKNFEYYLPRILSIDPQYRSVYQLNRELECVAKKDIVRASHFENAERSQEKIEQDLRLASEYLAIISSTRADAYDSWMEIGFVLYNIGEGCNEALDLWIEFSSQTSRENFSETECVYKWKHCMTNERKFTLGTLDYYARQDNPEQYEKIKAKRTKKFIKDSLNGGHHDIARMLYNKVGNKFVCASIIKKVWYEYSDITGRWSQTECGIKLRSLISTDLVEDYRKLQKKIIEELDEDDNEDEAEKVRKSIRKIIANLKCATFKNQVMKECEEVFYDEEFLNRLDKNVYLIGFENGVYDLKEGKFRPGKPEDYMAMTTKYDYREFNEDDPEIAEVNEFLLKIFPDKTLRDFFIKKSAEELQGGNFTKTFVVMTGVGDNGKSITIELKELAFGQYAIKLPTSLITGKRTQSSGATPELERMIGVRFAVLQEPDNKDVINIGMLKELTGNDSMYVRGLYKEGKEVKPMFKLVLVCNKLPRLPCDDPATWNRIRVLEFESRFPKNASEVPKTFEEQIKKKVFPRDENMSEKLNYMKYPFMWMLTQEYKRLQSLKVREPDPDVVMKATLIYRENNDIFFQFVREKYVSDPSDKDAVLTVPVIYEVFKHWFRDSFPNLKVPTKNELKEDLLLRWKDCLTKDGKFVGYREKSAIEIEKKEPETYDDKEEEEEKKDDDIEQHDSHKELYDTDEVEESICINRDTDDENELEESIVLRRDDEDEDDLEKYLND